MTRWLLVLVACSKEEPVVDGVSRVHRAAERFGVNGPITVVGEACHVDDKIVPCS